MRTVIRDDFPFDRPHVAVSERSDSGDATDLERARAKNLRYLLTRATRGLNERVVATLREHGYADVRLSHSALLVNMTLAGSTLTELAERAGMPKQAVGKLVAELETMGFVAREPHPYDGRAWRLTFTRTGRLLLKRTVAIVATFEREAAAVVGERRYADMCESLRTLERHWAAAAGDERS